MKRLTTLLIVALLPLFALAQNPEKFTVKGTALDSIELKAAPYATVLLTTATNEVAASTYTDERGKFSFKAHAGDYTLRVNFVGFAPYTLPLSLSEDTDLGEILIKEDIEIEAVEVRGQLITSDIDKLSYNTDMDPEAPALTALEMMRKVPMLSVDGEDNIRLKGESNFKILVNGKSSSLMNSNYQEVLRSMPANSIKRIEVITNPPAKYDAEGVGGIINIITVKRGPEGISGTLTAGYSSFNTWRAGGFLAVSKGKFNLSASLNAATFSNPENIGSGTIYNYTSDALYQQDVESTNGYDGNYYGVNVEASYEFDTLNLLTFSINGSLGASNSHSDSHYNTFSMLAAPTAEYSSGSSNYSEWGGIGASLDYQRSFAHKPDRLLTASYKIDYNPNDSESESALDLVFADEDTYLSSYTNRSSNDAYGMEHALQIDYFDKLTKNHQIEAGVKYTLRPSTSESLNETLLDGVWYEDLSLKNDLDYIQHIGSIYAAYQYSLKDFSVKAGARGEYTRNDGTFISEVETPLDNEYFNLIPYLTIGYKINDFQNLRLGYTQRISRPGISQLNPYVSDQGVMVSTGNPDLTAELSNSIDLSYNLFKMTYNLNTSFTARFTNNAIQTISTVVGTQIIMRPENIGKNQSYIASLGGGLRLWGGKFSVYANASGGYVKVEANDGTGLENDGWQYNTFVQLSANPWKDGTVSLYGGNGHNMVTLQSDDMSYYFSGVSVSQNFFEKRLGVNLSVSSPLEKYTTVTYGQSDNYMSFDYTQKMYQRSATLSLTWRFGQQSGSVKRTKRSIESTDTVTTSDNPAL